MKYGDVNFSVYPMECKRVRVEALTKCQDGMLWTVHVDLGPNITGDDVKDTLQLLLYRLVQRAQTESSTGVIGVI